MIFVGTSAFVTVVLGALVQTAVETGNKREIHTPKEFILMLEKEQQIKLRLLGKEQEKRAVLVSWKGCSLSISLANMSSRLCVKGVR